MRLKNTIERIKKFFNLYNQIDKEKFKSEIYHAIISSSFPFTIQKIKINEWNEFLYIYLDLKIDPEDYRTNFFNVEDIENSILKVIDYKLIKFKINFEL